MRVLIMAPHPDDEVLGCGGTIAKLSKTGDDVFIAIATKARPPQFCEEIVAQGRKEAKLAHEILGVKETIFCDLPAAALDTTEHREINHTLSQLVHDIKPQVLFVPFLGDIHLDHQHIFLSALVATRPNQSYFPIKILSYETLSETNWNAPYLTPGFHPNVFIDISSELSLKLKALSIYKSQIKPFPHERSQEASEALAKLRGATVHVHAAEAFVLIREVIK